MEQTKAVLENVGDSKKYFMGLPKAIVKCVPMLDIKRTLDKSIMMSKDELKKEYLEANKIEPFCKLKEMIGDRIEI